MNHLIICHTPLQVLIARQIIAQQPQQSFHGVMFSYEDNAKFQHYFKQLSDACRGAAQFVLLTPQQPAAYLSALNRLSGSLQDEYDTAYCASINSMMVHYLLSRSRFTHLETFDDGTGNILPDSIFYRPPPLSVKQKLLRKLLGVSWDSRQIIARSRLHYTLFPQFDNIIPNTRGVSLMLPDNVATGGKVEKILLGQPTMDNPAANARLFERIAEQFGISRYFPHPREQRLPDLDCIDSDKIFEDWLARRRQLEADTVFELYHLFSTAALNTAHLNGIRSLAVDVSAVTGKELSPSTRTLFARFGIETLIFKDKA
ncbi:glycosyltransferase family 52 [Conchiformibius kuhniae]|uniref:Glycosyltransferase family 52 n=1 Tax=Conchiformibius kuhniae TaxID=211502 RepID=A0A8T9MWA7_9NEIS|nr:glycosyltransferase family 52 [Conchiformibius kuhniae]UOP04746.1 glycosyltransferase family 52 protein [Conchiformibius kuhniae]